MHAAQFQQWIEQSRRILAGEVDASPAAVEERHQQLEQLASAMVAQRLPPPDAEPLPVELIGNLARLSRENPDFAQRWRLIEILAADGSREAFQEFAQLILDAPLEDPHHAALAFVPLFRHGGRNLQYLFPRLLDALGHKSVAGLVLDLANFATQRRFVPQHPAADRVMALGDLLGAIVNRLEILQQSQATQVDSPQDVRSLVGVGGDLVIGLCVALALIGDARIVGKLHQALRLRHRRLHTEAAAALARFQDQAGIDALKELAADPAARTRALAYLEELGLEDRVDAQFKTAEARAVGKLADWLSSPLQFGLPPHEIELVDKARQYWPGYSEPCDCFLIQFTYHVRGEVLDGVGIVGPVIHALAADLSDLPPAEIYACYAGWHAEHDEISQRAVSEVDAATRELLRQQSMRLAVPGYSDIEWALVGQFFGDEIYVAQGKNSGQPGCLVVDGPRVHWFPRLANRRPPGPIEAWQIFKGRKLLSAFNR